MTTRTPRRTHLADVYGAFGDTSGAWDLALVGMGRVLQILETRLGLRFEAHDSSYCNGLYFAQCGPDESFSMTVYNNAPFDDLEEIVHLQFADFPVVINVSGDPAAVERIQHHFRELGYTLLTRTTVVESDDPPQDASDDDRSRTPQ